MSLASADTNLKKIDHIVVLMMENRSFDHMLGHLKLDDPTSKVDGLTEQLGNHDADGVFHHVEPLGNRLINEKVLDPGHGRGDVAKQLKDRNDGFLKNYIEVVEARFAQGKRLPDGVEFDPTLVLGYQTAGDVPVYNYLAHNYQVCHRWFSSVPGPTWENRLFAVTGGTGPRISPLLGQVPHFLKDAPIYDRPAFVRWLDNDDWRWYSHDPATLRLIDSQYRPGGAPDAYKDSNFAYFNRKTLFERRTFLDDAANDELPGVSWIDPNFVDFRFWGPPGSNDDHPPSRVMLGQELVLTVVDALMKSKAWPKTLLLITYDEHGGFYDHVVAGDFPVAGDAESSYGVRVPTLVISPYVEAGVCDEVFDHTSIPKTILTRFSDRLEEALDELGPRTAEAKHLGELLTRPADDPRPSAPQQDIDPLIERLAEWRQRAYREQLLEEVTPEERVYDVITEFQGDVVSGAIALRDRGARPAKP
jgi:phospholipase C